MSDSIIKDNIITFSLWGKNPRYVDGLKKNLDLIPTIYPNWKVVLYCDYSVDMKYLKEINALYDIDIRIVQDTEHMGPFYGAYWRFFINDDENVDRYIVRDLDSRVNWREKAAVDEWIKSGKDFHIMRDHQNHTFPIQGGMWGGRANIFKIIPMIQNYATYDQYGCDQFFLSNIIYPMIKDNTMVHDPFFEKKPFPNHKPIEDGGSFVGQIYLNDIPQPT